jgi:hypothetical protein
MTSNRGDLGSSREGDPAEEVDTHTFSLDRRSRHPMTKHLAPTYLLSVGIVLVCAIALYRSDPPRKPSRPQAVARAEPVRHVDVEPKAVERPTVVRTEVAPRASTPVEARPVLPTSTVVRQVAQSRPRPRPTPRGAFTVVEEGETLADVAIRVYGDADRADDLWRSNRDQAPGRTGLLRAGMLLRTP